MPPGIERAVDRISGSWAPIAWVIGVLVGIGFSLAQINQLEKQVAVQSSQIDQMEAGLAGVRLDIAAVLVRIDQLNRSAEQADGWLLARVETWSALAGRIQQMEREHERLEKAVAGKVDEETRREMLANLVERMMRMDADRGGLKVVQDRILEHLQSLDRRLTSMERPFREPGPP